MSTTNQEERDALSRDYIRMNIRASRLASKLLAVEDKLDKLYCLILRCGSSDIQSEARAIIEDKL